WRGGRTLRRGRGDAGAQVGVPLPRRVAERMEQPLLQVSEVGGLVLSLRRVGERGAVALSRAGALVGVHLAGRLNGRSQDLQLARPKPTGARLLDEALELVPRAAHVRERGGHAGAR